MLLELNNFTALVAAHFHDNLFTRILVIFKFNFVTSSQTIKQVRMKIQIEFKLSLFALLVIVLSLCQVQAACVGVFKKLISKV